VTAVTAGSLSAQAPPRHGPGGPAGRADEAAGIGDPTGSR